MRWLWPETSTQEWEDVLAEARPAVYGSTVAEPERHFLGWLGEVALKKEAMGFGDVTLMALIGAALVVAARQRHHDEVVPGDADHGHGPVLALGGVVLERLVRQIESVVARVVLVPARALIRAALRTSPRNW
mgnify:CR=1 FL=1